MLLCSPLLLLICCLLTCSYNATVCRYNSVFLSQHSAEVCASRAESMLCMLGAAMTLGIPGSSVGVRVLYRARAACVCWGGHQRAGLCTASRTSCIGELRDGFLPLLHSGSRRTSGSREDGSSKVCQRRKQFRDVRRH